MLRLVKICVAVFAACCGGCAEQLAAPAEGIMPPVMNPITQMNRTLRQLPPPDRRVAVAVYGYTDQTGQFKQADAVQSLSRAVTQGATSVLIKALQDAGEGSWFTVVERERLDNLLKERRIIADMRERYLGEKGLNPQALPPLLFAGILLEGGIIGYDSDTKTGGAGARYLGVGGDVKYRDDTVTIYLRAISTKTGEVLVSVVSHKTIVSVGIQGGAFKYVALDKILEAEAGITRNEPEQLAVQQTVEKAVYALIVEGSARGLWAFGDRAFQDDAIRKFDGEQASSLARLSSARQPPQAVPTAVAAGAPVAPAPSVASHPPKSPENGPGNGMVPVQPAAIPTAPQNPAPRLASATPPLQQRAPELVGITPPEAASSNGGWDSATRVEGTGR